MNRGGKFGYSMRKTKYPRTPHLPWSLGKSKDDESWLTAEPFFKKDIVITEKMDGENTTIYSDGTVHARSLDSQDHPSRHWIKAWAKEWQFFLPEDWRIVGENCYAEHSIHYNDLASYFLVFAIINEYDICLSWEEVENFCYILGLHTVPVLARTNTLDTTTIYNMQQLVASNQMEGYVVRLADSFPMWELNTSVAKYVRADHVQTDDHWLNKPVKKNGLSDAGIRNLSS
jgi:hypothetical protein